MRWVNIEVSNRWFDRCSSQQLTCYPWRSLIRCLRNVTAFLLGSLCWKARFLYTYSYIYYVNFNHCTTADHSQSQGYLLKLTLMRSLTYLRPFWWNFKRLRPIENFLEDGTPVGRTVRAFRKGPLWKGGCTKILSSEVKAARVFLPCGNSVVSSLLLQFHGE